MQNAGLIESTATATTSQITALFPRLNDLINVWQTQGCKLWLMRDVTVPLTAGQADYELGPSLDVSMARPLRVDLAYYLSTSGARRGLLSIARSEYKGLSNTTSLGSVSSYYAERLSTKLVLWFWSTPSAAEAAGGSVHADVRAQVDQFDGTTASTAFPDEWALSLQWGLADEICTGQPEVIMARCKERAMFYRNALDDFEVENTEVRFEMDTSRGYRTGGFR